MKNITLLEAILRQTMKAESAFATAMELCETHSEDPDAEVAPRAIERLAVKAATDSFFMGDSEIPRPPAKSKSAVTK